MAGEVPQYLADSACGARRPFVAAGIPYPQQQQADSSSSSYMPLLAYDESLLLHAPPADSSHPERPDRTAVIMARLAATGLTQRCRRIGCREATTAELTAVHDPQLVREVQAASKLQQQEAAEAATHHLAKQQQQQEEGHKMLGQPPAPQDISPFSMASAATAAAAAGGPTAVAAADDGSAHDSPMLTPRSRSCSVQPPQPPQSAMGQSWVPPTSWIATSAPPPSAAPLQPPERLRTWPSPWFRV